jgi:hypothetical protein
MMTSHSEFSVSFRTRLLQHVFLSSIFTILILIILSDLVRYILYTYNYVNIFLLVFLKVLQCLSCANVTYKIRTKVASHHKFHAPNCNLGRSHASISLFIKGSLVKEFMKLRLLRE